MRIQNTFCEYVGVVPADQELETKTTILYYRFETEGLSFCLYEHIELPAKLLDYFLRSNKSNMIQPVIRFVHKVI